jgi:hypothetical protein
MPTGSAKLPRSAIGLKHSPTNWTLSSSPLSQLNDHGLLRESRAIGQVADVVPMIVPPKWHSGGARARLGPILCIRERL